MMRLQAKRIGIIRFYQSRVLHTEFRGKAKRTKSPKNISSFMLFLQKKELYKNVKKSVLEWIHRIFQKRGKPQGYTHLCR